MTHPCEIESKSAALSGDFGQKMLRLKFPETADKILAELGVYSRGPRKGLPRGYIHWDKVAVGGWNYNDLRLERGLQKPGCYNWAVSRDGADDFINVSFVGRRYEILDAHPEAAGGVLMDNVTFDVAINKGQRVSDYRIRDVEDLAVGERAKSFDGTRELLRVA